MQLISSIAILVLVARASSWEYSEQENWGAEFPMCNGDRQSPIELSFRRASLRRQPNGLQFSNYNAQLTNWTLTNNGHTVNAAPGQLLRGPGYPSISGSSLPGTFVAQSFHFHWGSTSNRGSEHTLEGRNYSMEVHIVHVNDKYETLEEALANRDGLAVLGMIYYEALVPIGPESYQSIAEQLPEVIDYNTSTPLPADFTLNTIMDRVLKEMYFTYDGSLTTPECSEAVSWIVFRFPIRVSRNVLTQLRRLRDERGNYISNNFRYVQELGNRRVFNVIGA